MNLLNWARSLGRTPVVPLLGFPGVRLAGNRVGESLSDPAKLAAAARAVHQAFHPDAVFMLMDLTVEAQALGIPVHMPGDDCPSVAGHPVTTPAEIKNLRPPDPERDGRMPVFLEAAQELAAGGDILVCAYVIGPFTLAAELAGAEFLAEATILDPGFVEELCGFCTRVVRRYAAALAGAGVRVVAVLDPTAVILSPRFFSRFAAPGISRCAGAIGEAGAAPLLHVCGDSTHLLPGMAATGVAGLSLDSPVDLPAAAAALAPELVVIGNVAPVSTMLEAGPERVDAEARELVSAMAGRPGFILSSGCDLPWDTPPENIRALISAVRQAGPSARQAAFVLTFFP